MLSDAQRAALTARLRAGRPNLDGEIPRRPAGLTELPLSYGQEQLWFIDQFAPGQPTYNIPLALRVSGPLDPGALGRALDGLRARHEALRTRLVPGASGRPAQVIDPAVPAPLAVADLSGLSPPDRAARLAEIIDAEALRPFALATDPLLRAGLLRLAAAEHVLLVVVHHVVFDGWSVRLLVPELAALYRHEVSGEPPDLAELTVQFADYALWERSRLGGALLERLEDYWRGVMAGFEPVPFPTDRPRPVVDSFEGGLAERMTGPQLLGDLRRLSSQLGTTPFVILMAALQALLCRYTGQTDIVVGTVSANRGRAELTPLIGFLVNTLPVRADLSGDPPFTELAARVRDAAAGAYAHQDLPFARLVETLQVERDPGRSPVFQISLTYAERDAAAVRAAGAEFALTDLVAGIRAAKFDLALLAEARPGGLWLECSYKTRLFDPATIGRLLAHFEVLLQGAVTDPSARLSQLPLLTPGERRRELAEWNDTAGQVPAGCVQHGFAAQVARTPDAVAAEFGPQWISYRQLSRRAGQVARRLRAAGAGPEVLVGVCLPAGLTRLAALLGVWQAGAGYLPLDPALPAGRLAFMMADAGLRIVLADDSGAALVPPAGATVISLEPGRAGAGDPAGVGPAVADAAPDLAPDPAPAGNETGPANVAYVIYTSGSTGQPKGVVIEHRQASNFLHGMVANWQIGPGDVVLQFGSLSFDASVMDTFVPLLGGARVVLAPAQTLHSPPRLAALMRTARVTFTLLPPAVLSLLDGEQFGDLRLLMSGGEALTAEVAGDWLRPGLRLVNAYGPTEATVIATYAELQSAQAPPPIGRPNWPNYRVYVLDPYLNPVPAGVTGQLYIGGPGVARGYLNRPALTAQRFIPDPFGAGLLPGARLYASGDLVRRRPDGMLVFAGRIDSQVKIRGLRIELGEIEAALAAHPAVAQVFVTVVTDAAGQPQLAGYLRARPGLPARRGPGPAELTEYLARTLPAHMIPAWLITVDELPLNASGKVDKAALPRPQIEPPDSYAEPATAIEAVLASLFARLLGRERVGATDSFFEIGGNSLAAMRLIGMISDELTVALGAAAVFLAPTARQLAALLRSEHGFTDVEITDAGIADAGIAGGQDPADSGELAGRLRAGREARAAGRIRPRPPGLAVLPASFGQEQLWFLDRFAPGQSIYHVPVTVTLLGALDAGALRRAVDAVAARHEVLRTRLVAGQDGRPVQVIDPPPAGITQFADYTCAGAEQARRKLRVLADDDFRQPFRLAHGPLLRAHLVRLDSREHVLLLMIHHAVFDGWSARLLLTDLAALYQAEVTGGPSGLAPLAVQFADYACWEREMLQGPALARLEDYWHRVLDGVTAVRFPADRPRPAVESFEGEESGRLAGPGVLAGLTELSRREGTTLFVTVMAALQALLHRYTGQTDIVVGTVSADRTMPELEPLIGFLVNTLPVRADLSGDPAFTQLLARVKVAVLGAYDHQRLPFGRLVETLQAERQPGRAPVFQIMLSYADGTPDPVSAAGVSFAVAEPLAGAGAAKFDLDFQAQPSDGGLWLECSYKTGLFDRATIDRLLGHLEVLLHAVIADPSARLSRLPVLTEAELRRELTDWNDTAAPVPAGCVHEGFAAQVARTPDAVAVAFGPEQVSYLQLSRQADLLARRLRAAGAGPEMLAGVCMRTGPWRLAALLGIWRAGAGYLPMDPALPAERLAFMMADSGLSVVLADDATAALVPPSGAEVISLRAGRAAAGEPGEPGAAGLAGTGTGAEAGPANVAYVIYTSGSTGQPKGVVIEHRQAMSFLHAMIGHWQIGPRDAVLQFASLSFDASVHEIFMPLLAGGRVVLAPADTLHSPPRLAALMRERAVTFACLTPSVASLLAGQQIGDLRVLMCGGEELPAGLARRWMRPGLRFANDYGPTETTVSALFMELDTDTVMPPPIGRPLAGYRAYVLDAWLNPVPAGVTGELHIGGAGVARGYLNRPGLTGQRFIPDPFGAEAGARLYRTGDLARRRPDGTIVFAGRMDSQVKVAGLRIELGEIEAALAAHPAVSQAAAAVAEDPAGDRQLVGYLRAEPGTGPSEADLRAHLARVLPAYMIPARLITVAGFPLNASGKIDRAVLPAPDDTRAGGSYLEPASCTEAVLADLYATVLRRDRVGATDSFFDLGGSSLQVMRLVSEIGRELGVDVGVSTIFRHATPRELAASIDSIRSGAARPAATGPLVELGSGTGRLPVFLIHAVGGTVFAYAQLARELADTFGVYGLEAPGLSEAGATAASLAELVADYVTRIREVQPDGPYRLAGWSMGGVVAFEMARLLERDGAEVGLLALLDAPFAVPRASRPAEAVLAGRFVTDAAHSLGWDLGDAPDPARSTADDQLAWLAGRMSTDDPDGETVAALLRRRFGVFSAHDRMLAGYQAAGPQVSAATLIVSADGSPNAPARARWPLVLTGQVATRVVAGDHYTFLRPPGVTEVSASILKWHEGSR